MCTALKYKHIMGRNFDYEISYGEEFTIIPSHQYGNEYSIMGICTMYTDANGIYPLLYDGMNEKGLCMAGLAFEGNAYYVNPDNFEEWKGKRGISVYNFIFKILSACESVNEVELYIDNIILIDKQISSQYPNSDMHWFVCDQDRSIVIEQTKEGLKWYNAQTDVLTNNPVYPEQLKKYLSNKNLIGKFKASYHTRGNETEGLNGSYTSSGRFQRVSYLKEKAESLDDKFDATNQTLHLLSSVEQIYGATPVNDSFEYTIYSIAYDMKNLCVSIKTYDNHRIHFISLKDIESNVLKRFKI